MKQFDTVKNNEWVPTEEDLSGAIRVVDALPTASASEEGVTYLLNGTMEGYTKTHFYKCVQETDDSGVTRSVWRDLNVGKYSVGNCSNIRIMMFDDNNTYRVIISWKDPEDVIVGSEHIYWKETRLVHQIGHMPVDVNDCVDTMTNSVRDQFSSFGSYSTTIAADGRKHYFKLFPVSMDGAITNDDANGRVAGYNYTLTADSVPNYDYTEKKPLTTYYKRSLDPVSKTYVYTERVWDSNNFDGGGTSENPWRFKADEIYYEYQNAFINWSGIRDLIKNGEASKYFPVKSIMVLPYHGDFGEMSFEVVDYDTVQPADSTVEHTMTLQAKYLNRWWDYNGGVVFDTNERGGAKTSDTGSRDPLKVYFSRIRLDDSYALLEPFASTKSIEGTPAEYVETISDATVGTGDTIAAAQRGPRLLWSNTGSWGFPAMSSLYECELPYTTIYRADVPASISINTPTGTKAFTIAPASRYACSDMRRTGEPGKEYKVEEGLELTIDTVAQPNKTYYQRTGSGTAESPYVYSIVSMAAGAAITAGTRWETTSRVLNPQMNSTYTYWNVTSGTTLTSKYIIRNFAAAAAAWSGSDGGTTIKHQGLTVYSRQPRSNLLADRFLPVFPYGTSGASADYRSYNAAVKYFVPAEVIHSKYVDTYHATTAGARNYYTYWYVFNRDCTAELNGIMRYIDANKASSTTSPDYKQCSPYVEGTYSSAGKYTISLDRICGAMDSGIDDGTSTPVATNPRPWLMVPTTDERYVEGKIYYKAEYTDITSSHTVVVGEEFYRKVTGSSTGTDYSDPTHYRRVYIPAGRNITAADNLAKVTYHKMEPTTGTPGAYQYVVNDLVPIRSGMPYLTLKKGKTAGSTTAADYIWTMGEKDSGGDYTQCTKDFKGETTKLVAYSASDDTAANFYVPSGTNNQNIYAFRTTDIYEGAINIITTDNTNTSAAYKMATLIKSGCRVFKEVQPSTFVSGVTRYYYKNLQGKPVTVYCTTEAEFNTAKASHTLFYRAWIKPGTANSGPNCTFAYTGDPTLQAWSAATSYTGPLYVEYNNLYNKTPNLERVAYGNHVWAQSNIRMYFNGPFDSSQEYMHTSDGVFKSASSTTTYGYYKNENGLYIKLIAGNANDSNTYVVGTTISAWESLTGLQVYNRFPGGTPVGYKLDINRPDKYNDYGLSPVMQYTFDSISNIWVPKYASGNCWYSESVFDSSLHGDCGVNGEPLGRPSINNGLIYDRLAAMFWSNCILKGENSSTYKFSPKVDRTVSNAAEGGVYYGGYSTDIMKLHGKNLTGIDFNGTTSRSMKFSEILPRQSFLHGFLDCKYKRSNDQTYVSGKDYYLKSPYGDYDKLGENDPFILSGPYKHVLYELNGNYMNDLKDAKDFLDGIVPVVNRNGCYGTTSAYDFYPQTGAVYPNLGGTITIDKVWLASTAQVNGGSGANNGIYENPARDVSTVAASASLQKYAAYAQGTELNNARIKYGLTLGAHGTSGYADAIAGAQYWWLRSAGGYLYQSWTGFKCASNLPLVYLDGHMWESNDIQANVLFLLKIRLSPLITLG